MSSSLTKTASTQIDAYELAKRIAAQVSGPGLWTAQHDRTLEGELVRGTATLTRLADGAAISVTIGGYRQEGRVTFRARWPKYHDGQGYRPREYLEITCSADREPRALARELERRLLADYEPAFRKALDEVRESDAAAGAAWRTAERLAQAIGAEMPRKDVYRPRNGADVDLFGGPSHARRIKVRPGYDARPTRVSFEVDDVDEATARAILKLLADRPEAP